MLIPSETLVLIPGLLCDAIVWEDQGGPQSFGILVRGANMAVQSPEVAEALTRLSADLATMCSGPIAILAGSVLNKLQVSRLVSHERIRFFLDEEQAKSWLLATIPRSATSR